MYTFADRNPDPVTGEELSPVQRMKNLLEEISLADEIGLDVFGVGEHHRKDFLVSSPAVVLGAAAERTKNIRLTSAVSVLSSDDPVRVFQDFATLDLISGGRAEIMAGRGSFIESFPLFGYDLRDYDELFVEKLGLLMELRDHEIVSWEGKLRPSIDGLGVYPRPLQDPLPIWIAVGGSPDSVFRAGALGFPMALAIIGGMPYRFKELTDLYRHAATTSGIDPDTLQLSINSHGYVGDNTQAAADAVFPYHEYAMNTIGAERGWPPMTRERFDASYSAHGALLLGTPEEVADKIIAQHKIFNHDRFLLQTTVGMMPHEMTLRSIELFGTKVAPIVRKALGATKSPAR